MPRKTKSKTAKLSQVVSQLGNLRLHGEIITWDAQGPHGFSKVRQALTDCNLDPKLARERLPQHAFTRACKALEEERLIEEVRDDGKEIVFQFSKRAIVADSSEGGEQIEYRKEAKIRLDKDTGKITCRNAELQAKAQKELDRHLDERTTSDITTIVMRLFDQSADLMPLRRAGGVYFVPITHQSLILQVHEFLSKLGGQVNRLPVPEGTQYGDQTVQNCVDDYLGKLVEDHALAVKNLSMFTRQSSIEEAAEKINATRVKIEAYAQYLADKKQGLLDNLTKISQDLVQRVDEIAGEKEKLAETNGHDEPAGKDEFGTRLKTQAAAINVMVKAAGKRGITVKEVAEALTADLTNVRDQFKRLVAKGFATLNGSRVQLLPRK